MNDEKGVAESDLQELEPGHTVCVFFNDTNKYSDTRVEETNSTLEKFKVVNSDPLILEYDKYVNNGNASTRLLGERFLLSVERGLVAQQDTNLDDRFLGSVTGIYRPASDYE